MKDANNPRVQNSNNPTRDRLKKKLEQREKDKKLNSKQYIYGY